MHTLAGVQTSHARAQTNVCWPARGGVRVGEGVAPPRRPGRGPGEAVRRTPRGSRARAGQAERAERVKW